MILSDTVWIRTNDLPDFSRDALSSRGIKNKKAPHFCEALVIRIGFEPMTFPTLVGMLYLVEVSKTKKPHISVKL
jgi:hypothetical protein